MSASKRARRRRRATGGRKPQAPRSQSIPRPVRLIGEAFDELGAYVTAAEDPQSAAELARQNLNAAVWTIVGAMAAHDSLDVAEGMAVRTLLNDPETYSEAEHEGNLGALELVALIACSRSVIADSAAPGLYDLGAQPDVDQVESAATEALDAGTAWRLFTTMDEDHPVSGLAFHLALQEVNLRSTSYPHMVRDTLQALLGDPETDRDLEVVTGFRSRELLAVADHLLTVRNTTWNARIQALRQLHPAFGTEEPDIVGGDFLQRAEAAFTAAFANPSQAAVLEPGPIAEATNVALGRVERILDFLSCDVSALDADTLAEQYFQGINPLRTRPILRHPTGRRYLTDEALVLPALRERVENTLNAANNGSFSRYIDRRRDVVESTALQLLGTIFPTAQIFGGVEYFVPERPDQTTPATYTKRVEGDGLLLIDDVAIIMEAKAGALPAAARSSNPVGLRRSLTKLLSEGADQADRTRERIVCDRGLRLADDSWLDLSAVREIHTIVITLEDLSGLTAVTDELVTAGLLPSSLLPLTISLHDLRVIAELVERPAEFLLYLRRRTLPELTRQFLAPDELDLYLHLLQEGLYVEPDPDQLAAEVPHLTPTTAQRRRFKAQRPQWLTTRTGPLDTWYAYQLGQRTTQAEKPRLNGDPALLALVDQISASAEPGWLSTATSLLSGSPQTQRSWGRYGPNLARMTRRDQAPHTLTAMLADRAQTATVLGWVSTPPSPTTSGEPSYEQRLHRYLAAKKHQMGVTRGAIMMFDADGQYRQLLFLNTPPGQDPALDAEVIALGLTPLEQMNGSQASMAVQRKRHLRR